MQRQQDSATWKLRREASEETNPTGTSFMDI
jgi:hypothetical protein